MRSPREPMGAKFLAQARTKQRAYEQKRAVYTSQFRGAGPPSDPAKRPRGRIEDTRQARLLFSPAKD